MSPDGALHEDPFEWFADSFARAARSESFEPARAALATVDEQGAPSVRYVLVRLVDARGFAFFTHLGSTKAQHLTQRPRAALAFHWSSVSEQVRVEGRVGRVSDAEADAYFATRPRGSQLSAWTSEQSAPIASRALLEAKLARVEQRFIDMVTVPRPPDWGGFRLEPTRIEFWHDRPNRLHDRWSFTRAPNGWLVERLQP
jgi:pyridoxamine 5'-phosphate oxidase